MAYINLDSPNSNNMGLPGGTAGPDPNRPPRRPARDQRTAYPRNDDFAIPRTGIAPNGPVPGTIPGPTPPPNGYPYPTPPPPQAPPPQQGGSASKEAILAFLRKYPLSTESLRTAFPLMLQQGILPQGSHLENKSTADEIYIPGYGWVDFMHGADTGRPTGEWNFDISGPDGFFDDPIGSWFSQMVGGVIGQLGQPRELPGEVNESYNILKQLTQQRGGGAPDLSELRDHTRSRVAQLQAEPFSQTEEAAQRVKAFDNLERSRAVAIQQVRERLAAQGHDPSSGTVEAAIQQVNQSFDGLRAGNENSLLLNNIDERQRRKSEAMTIEQQLADRMLSASSIDEQSRSSAGNRSIAAAQSMAQIAQYIGNFMDPSSRLGMLLQAIGMIPNYAQQQFSNARDVVSED